MSHTIYAGNVSKRKNSTLQPSLSTSFDVLLKTPTSLHMPTFTISASAFDYNYLKWNDRYYFVTDVVARNNSLFEVSAVVDVLATYKSDILASTQFVSYSSVSGGNWIADTRIPTLKNATVARNATTMNFLFTDGGFYVLSAVGKDGCHAYCVDSTLLDGLIDDLSSWTDDITNDFLNNLPTNASTAAEAVENLYNVLARSGAVGNAYTDAPSCIRSCIWVPFFASFFAGSSKRIYLGQYDTTKTAFLCKSTPVSRTVTVSIPWQFTDWRRAVCEEIYLYLPLVGLVNVPSDEIVNETSLSITWSATATDGCIAYIIKAGSQVVGTYGANCSVNYPIGISQQASAGEIVQSVSAGAQKTISGGITGGVTGAIGNGLSAAYDVLNVASTAHNSCVGGIGGGAGTGLDLDAICFSVAHPTIITPSEMAATMGVPTMKPLQLSNCSGYCQCANAHVSAAAESQELDAIDAFLNSGFYIE